MKNPFRSRETAALNVPETKAAQPLIALQLGGGAHWTPREFTALSREGYARNPVAYRCVRMISEAAASVPLQTRRGGQALADDPAARFISRKPLFLLMSNSSQIDNSLIDTVFMKC